MRPAIQLAIAPPRSCRPRHQRDEAGQWHRRARTVTRSAAPGAHRLMASYHGGATPSRRRLGGLRAHLSTMLSASASPAAAAEGAEAATHGFGIVGCGMISSFHTAAIAGLGGGARLVGCYDAVASSAERFGAEHGCAIYSSLDSLLEDSAVTIVTICTPSGLHMEPAVAAAQHGKHVLVEKPLEVTLSRW